MSEFDLKAVKFDVCKCKSDAETEHERQEFGGEKYQPLVSLKRISWCGCRGAGRVPGRQREKTKAQLLF